MLKIVNLRISEIHFKQIISDTPYKKGQQKRNRYRNM